MNEPLFSVVIPTFNRRSELIRCMESIVACRFDSTRFEVIVVNDGGSSLDDVATLSAFAGISVRIITQPNRGPAAARNRGAAAARGQYLAFIDDDCMPAVDWLTRLEDSVTQFPRALIGGQTVNVLTRNSFSQASQTLVDYVYHYYNDEASTRTRFFASNNLTANAAMFAEVGGFDEAFRTAEDRDFCRMWHAKGWEFRFDPGIVIQHSHHLTLRSLHQQHFSYGRGALPYWKKGAELSSTRFKVEPLGFYSGMLLHPFSQRVANPASISGLILLSQVANAAGFAYEAIRSLAGAREATVAAHSAAKI